MLVNFLHTIKTRFYLWHEHAEKSKENIANQYRLIKEHKKMHPAAILTITKLDEHGKLSIAQCKAILCKDGAVYTDEGIALLRQTLYTLAEIDYNYHCKFKQSIPSVVIPLEVPTTTTNDHDQQTSHPLHPRLHRRAG